MLNRSVHAVFLKQETAQCDLRACIVRARSDGLLECILGLGKVRFARAYAGLDQCIAQESEQLIVCKSFVDSRPRNSRCLSEVVKHYAFLSSCEIANYRMRRQGDGTLKFRLGHARFAELPKNVAEFVMKPRGVRHIPKPGLQNAKVANVILLFREGRRDQKIKLFVLGGEVNSLLKCLESLFGLIVALISLREQILYACVFMASVAQSHENGNRFREFAYSDIAERQVEFRCEFVGDVSACGQKMRDRLRKMAAAG